jgi:hypothetical protein
LTTYSYSQLETLWLDTAKGTKYATDAWAQLMAAIAMAESSGNSTAYNASGATGLWQILGAVEPADQANLTDPTVNAHEALLKLESQGLGAWVTYTSGAYKQFLQGTSPSSLPTTSGSGSNTATTDSSLINPFPTQITGFFGDAKTFIDALLWLVNPASWLRIGSFWLAIILLILAATIFLKVGSDEPIFRMPSSVPVPVPV